MDVEERLVNKVLYKLFLIALKYIPILITIFYIINTLLCWIDIDLPMLSNIAGMSLLTWLFMYIATYVFKFCSYHRLLLYYILAVDCINIYDYYFTINLDTYTMLKLYTSLIGLLFIVLLINHVKSHKRAIVKNNS